ncbi:MAG: nucleotidyltransferase domain-containing protein [Schwartzia sp.]|nr:nucleotidyltransferase domain-containing protein [Schwartzia sp. (in: firmicutes)]
MRTAKEIQPFLDQYTQKIKELYGADLNKIILYGSYARGDYHEDSDIDIMILLNVPHEQERDKIRLLINTTYDFNFDNDLDIQPIPKSLDLFQQWKNVLPFYKNVEKEGVILYDNRH